ncbi:MAG: hypothetical protein ACQEQF_08240 [Bacillota bacterium]
MSKIIEVIIILIHILMIFIFIGLQIYDNVEKIQLKEDNKLYYFSSFILFLATIIFVGALILKLFLGLDKAKWDMFFAVYTKGILFSYIITILIRLFAYCLAVFPIKIKKWKQLRINGYSKDVYFIESIFKLFFKCLLSFDYLIADLFSYFLIGESQDEIKLKKSDLIKFYNWFNFSFILIAASLVLYDRSNVFFKGIIVYRTFSRAVEIIFSFYSDVATKFGFEEKTSKLNRYDRISLAVFSYLEMIISFALIYNAYNVFDNLLLAIIESLKVMTFLGSFSDSRLYLNYIIAGQIFVSLTLVLFALAGYLSDDNSDDDDNNNMKTSYIELKSKNKKN